MSLKVLIIGWICLVQAAQAQLPSEEGCTPECVNTALRRAEVDRDRVGIAPHDLDMFDRTPRRTPLIGRLLASPIETPLLLSYFDEAFRIETPVGCAKALSTMSRWSGTTVRRGLIGDPLERAKAAAKVEEPLLAAIERVFEVGNAPPAPGLLDELRGRLGSTPLHERRAVATVLQVMCDAHQWVEVGLEPLPAERWEEALALLREPSEEEDEGASPFADYREMRDVAEAITAFELAPVQVGAQEIAFAVRELHKIVANEPPTWSCPRRDAARADFDRCRA